MKIERRRLENGLRVFFVHIPSARTLCAVFIVRAGWRYERQGIDVGVAHFLEHESFRGTSRRPTPWDISCEIEGVGGSSNAVTGPENIRYWVYAPARHGELAVDIVSDMVTNPLLEEEGIEIERGSIKEEQKGLLISPDSLLSEIFLPGLLFGDNPLGWVGIGTEEEIDKIDRDLMISYMNDLFTAPNSAVICVGKIQDADRLLEIIGNSFGSFPAYPPRRRKNRYRDNQTDMRLGLVERKIEQTLLGISFKLSPVRNRYALEILSTILGRGMSSRLFLNIRDRLGLAYAIHSNLSMYPDIAILSVLAGLDRAKWKDGLKAIVEELRLIREENIGEEEIDKAKEMMIAEIEFSLERPDMLALRLASSWSLSRKIQNPELVAKFIRSVTAADVTLVAGELFKAYKINCAVIGASLDEEEEVREILSAIS